MIEFVIREGPMFEAMIMNKEITNPDFRFLFENQSPAHVYYRWKLFSILQGDSQNRWSTKPFRMFKDGSIWKPPPLNPFLQGMPEELIKKEEDFEDRNKKGSLSNAQRKRLESMIRSLTPERERVGEAMVWCIEHAEAAHEICQCLAEALTNRATVFPKKIARLYLISDILHNCSVKISNASFFRKYLQEHLLDMTEGLHVSVSDLESRLRAEQAKVRVMKCFRAWEDWAVYPHEFLIRLQNVFLGIHNKWSSSSSSSGPASAPPAPPAPSEGARLADDVDGIPMDDVDGFPLGGDLNGAEGRGGVILKSSAAISALQGYTDHEDEMDDEEQDHEAIDGAPLDDSLDGVPLVCESPKSSSSSFAPGFVPSKWERVSPKRVEAQAMTLSKWDELEGPPKSGADSESDTTPVYDQPASPTSKADPALSTKKYEVDDEDLDGIPIMYEDYKRRSRLSSEEEEEEEEGDGEEEEEEDDEEEEEEEDYVEGRLDRTGGESEERRSRLRAVEIKVLQYQDELERGLRSLKAGYSLHRQVQHYRHKLIKKIERESRGSSSSDVRGKRRRSRSSSDEGKRPRSRKRSRSPHKSQHRGRTSRSPRRHRSRSPRKRRTHSRSPSRKHKKKSRH